MADRSASKLTNQKPMQYAQIHAEPINPPDLREKPRSPVI